ncbi:ABC transporter substrate-binding protein [Arcanobacterium hippocoleae]
MSVVEGIPDPSVIAGKFPQKLPATVTDTEGTSVTITDTSRILALDITATLSRTVIALGFGESIVGRSVSSTEKMLADLPVVSSDGIALNAEAILNLHPTVVFTDRTLGPPEVISQIQAAGIPVVITESDHSVETVGAEIEAVAAALGVPEAGKALAKRASAEITAAKEQIAQWTPKDPLKIAFLYVRGTAGVFFIFGGEEYGAIDLIEGVGGVDIAAKTGIKGLTPASAESLLTINPEVIFTMTGGLESTKGMEGLLARPGVSSTIAGKKQRVVAIPDGLSLAFGPQTGDVLLAVARALYGVK